MRISRRLPAAAGLVLLLAASGLLSAGATPAGALVPASITGAAPATAVSPGQVGFSYTITLPTAVDATSLSTTQDPALAASATGVTLDGNPVPAGQVQQSGADISVQTGAQPTDGLAAGSHTITFTAAVATTAAVTASSTATLNYTLAGSPASITSAPVPVALNQPDLSVILTPDSGEDQVGLLGTGRGLDMLVDVLNLGPNTPTADLQIDLPVGLKLGPDGVARDSGGRPLSCLADPGNPQQLHCPLGAIQPNGSVDPTLDIELTTATGAPAGQIVPITVSVHPELGQGTDTDLSNNSATAHIQLTGSARLSYTISPTKTKVALGAKTAVRLTIHNAGPQPAPQTIAFTILVGGTFNVVSFTGQTAPPPGAGSAELPATVAASAQSGAELLWFAGDIPAGHSVSAILTIQARAVGRGQVGVAAFSAASDPNCPNFACDPVTVAVTAVPVAAPAPASTGGPVLAATGQDWSNSIGLGWALVLAGCLLAFTGRRPAYAGRRRAS